MKTVITTYILLGAVTPGLPNSSDFFRRLTNRIDSVENTFITDTRNLRDDILALFDKLQRLETWSNRSFVYLPNVKNRNASTREDSVGVKSSVSKLQSDILVLKRGFWEERRLNSRARRSTWAVSTLSEKLKKHFIDFAEKIENLQSSLSDDMKTMKTYLLDVLSNLETFQSRCLPESCQDLLNQGYTASGVYKIRPAHMYEIDVYCDMETADRGWIVFQRREDGSVDFYRDWKDYKNGFGDMRSEFWLGNEVIHHLTKQSTWELRIDMEDFDGNSRYAGYSSFSLRPETDGYRLSLGSYNGSAGNSLSGHNNHVFVTKDRNDVNGCSNRYKGGWWYTNCHSSNLNGLFLGGNTTIYAKGVVWKAWKGYYYSLQKSEMKLRPVE